MIQRLSLGSGAFPFPPASVENIGKLIQGVATGPRPARHYTHAYRKKCRQED